MFLQPHGPSSFLRSYAAATLRQLFVPFIALGVGSPQGSSAQGQEKMKGHEKMKGQVFIIHDWKRFHLIDFFFKPSIIFIPL